MIQTLIYLIVFFGVIYFMSGSETAGNCLGGLLSLAFYIVIIVGSFAINPILGIIVTYLLIKYWRSKS